MTEQLTELELELLQRIDSGRAPESIISLQDQFVQDHAGSPELVHPHNAAPNAGLELLVAKLKRLGLITVYRQKGFGAETLTITEAGKAYLRSNAA
jgi:hypothetical protein